MSVVYHNLHWSGATGSISNAGKQYEAVYIIKTDDALDTAQTIIEYFLNTSSLPYLNAYYEYGNDVDKTAYCTSIEPQRDNNVATQWTVTVRFETPTTEKKNEQTKDGDTSDNPIDWRDRIRSGFTQIMIPVEQATYRSGFVGTAAALRAANTFGAVYNSAFIPFIPGLEREVHIRVIRREWYSDWFDATTANDFQGKVNSNEYNIVRHDARYNDIWGIYSALVKTYEASLEIVNGFVVWKFAIEFWVNPLGWRRKIVDRGLSARCMAGDPDGKGGTVSAGDIKDGMPLHRLLLDVNGNPIAEPVLFNGDGQPLSPDDEPVVLTYSVESEVNFPNWLMGME